MPLHTFHVFSYSGQVPHCLLFLIRYPHCRQLTRTIQSCQCNRIPPIRLHSIASFLWYQRGGDNITPITHVCYLPIYSISARPCFITKCCPNSLGHYFLYQLHYRLSCVCDFTVVSRNSVLFPYC